MMDGWGWRLALPVTALLVLPSLGAGMPPDQLECELALAHLVECCPAFAFDDKVCGSAGCEKAPALPEAVSRCMQELDCAALVESGVCSRAGEALAPGTVFYAPDPVGVQVCP
jgi:hypothetical protein